MMNSRFQRPILVQMLITLNYLTTFLKEEKERAELVAKQKGRAPEFVLEGDQVNILITTIINEHY